MTQDLEYVSLKDWPVEAKVAFLRALEEGYDSDGEFVLRNGIFYSDPYTHERVRLDGMMILPGSVVVLSNNPYSFARYLEQYGDPLMRQVSKKATAGRA